MTPRFLALEIELITVPLTKTEKQNWDRPVNLDWDTWRYPFSIYNGGV